MKKYQLRKGSTSLESLELIECDVPEPGEQQLLIRVHAASLNFRDQAIVTGLVRSCHDLSEGGLAVALAEMAFAGGVGVEVPDLSRLPGAEGLSDEARLFSESPTRFLLEVRSGHAAELRACLAGVPAARIGFTVTGDRVQLGESIDAGLAELKEAWQRPLRW